jgi:hypothetical protein
VPSKAGLTVAKAEKQLFVSFQDKKPFPENQMLRPGERKTVPTIICPQSKQVDCDIKG